MKIKVLYIVLLLVVFGGVPAVAAASGDLEIYRAEFREYRSSRTAYELAKEKYEKLGTLAARDEALQATKQFLTTGLEVLKSYSQMLRTLTIEHAAVDTSSRALITKLLSNDLEQYSNYQNTIESGSTLPRLETTSERIDILYTQKEANARLANAVLVMGDLRKLQQATATVAAQVKVTVEDTPDYPGRDRILGDWYRKITNKLEASTRILEASVNTLGGFEQEEDSDDKTMLVEKSLESLESCKQLNAEVINHLLEIVRAKKY